MTDPLVLPATYVRLTGDATTSTPNVVAAIDDATARLEERLERKLAQQSITERLLPDGDGRVYPTVTPIVSAPGYTVYGNVLVGGPFFTSPGFVLYDPRVQVTYTGGYVERSANPNAANRVPAHVEEDICWAAYILAHPANLAAAVASPAGATSARVGDAAVTWGKGGPPSPGTTVAQVWSAETLRLGRVRRRT